MEMITDKEREAFYKVLYNRRDTRGEFENTPIPEDILKRVLNAAHHAPSVGFMQPWDFIVVRDKKKKEKIKQAFEKSNTEATSMFEGEKQTLYKTLKLEGILEAPIGIVVTCDKSRSGPVVLGRTVNKEMDTYSTVCAVQNLWLAARSENLGVGWVSILDHTVLNKILNIPENILPVAYLCIGYVSHFHERPQLEKVGWLPRIPIEELIHYDEWDNKNITI